MAPSTVVCSCCSRSCEAVSVVKCCICKKSFRNACVDVSSAELRTLNSNKGYDWTCRSCRPISGDIKDLKALILQLQEEIQNLKDTCHNSDAGSPTGSTNDTNFFEEVAAEVADRARRSKNLIIFGVVEQSQNLSSNDRKYADVAQVQDILKVLQPDISAADIKPIRLGKHSSNKNRPIQVNFDTDEKVRDVMKNIKKLANTKYHKKISISYDRTPKQQAFYRKVKNELQERINAGETNITIKYRNNIPVIVAEN